MNFEEIRDYCNAKEHVTEGFPFNDTALVFKVAGKMYALLDLSEESRGISMKCDPGLAIELIEEYQEVDYAWHFDKKHWIGVNLNMGLSDDLLKSWIDSSYSIVYKSLPAKVRREFES